MLSGLIFNKAGQHDLHGGEELLFILTDLQEPVFLYICLLKKQLAAAFCQKANTTPPLFAYTVETPRVGTKMISMIEAHLSEMLFFSSCARSRQLQ